MVTVTTHEARTDTDFLQVPSELANRVLAHMASQDAERGPWETPRDLGGVDPARPPWPAKDNPVLEYLVEQAMWNMEQYGMDQRAALLHLAVHAWFEGGIENYDRGQRDARS